MPNQFRRNHYVPIWYQRRFLPIDFRDNEFVYLNLKPDVKTDSKGRKHTLNKIRKLGPRKAFYEDSLYTTNLGGVESTDIEQVFFGRIDKSGRKAVDFFASFESPVEEMFEAFNDLIPYLCMQKFRTPKGLHYLSKIADSTDNNIVLLEMQRLQRIYGAMWSECIWSIVDASQSATKFIISDHPVTVYNEECKPESQWCRGSRDPDVRLTGTHTLFPPSLDKLLILTNLSWTRNPYGVP